MRIELFDPWDDGVAPEYVAFTLANTVDEWPEGHVATGAHLLTCLRHCSAIHRKVLWLARDGGEIVGTAEAQWWEAEDNRDRAYLHPVVAPHADPDAVLPALVAAAAESLEPLGRNVLLVEARSGGAVSTWAQARGGRVGSVEQHNVARLASLPLADVRAWAAAPPPGYELLAFDGDCPDEHLEAYTRLMDTMNDAPRDDLTNEDWVYTPDRVRDYERGLRDRGHTMWTVVARSVDTGEFAAFNQLVLMPEWPDVIENEDTAVAVPHRGHGLGLYVKSVNLLRALGSPASVVSTWNAASNTHMLRVNRALGFVCETEWDVVETTL
ncbi:MAG TPA: hypothetical protein VGX28_16555 [Frankiaceae bacterium]|nr:hypothetical protein [Frankiaceae bacterium]